MGIRRIIRERIVDKLPRRARLAAERGYFGFYMREEVRTIRRLSNVNRSAIDIGANKGDLTLFLSRFSKHVHCFEPNPVPCGILKKRYEGCNVSVHCCALGNVEGGGRLVIPTAGGKEISTRASLLKNFADEFILAKRVDHTREVLVSLRKLDSFCIENVGLIKIDVEGYELEVIEGAIETIIRNKPNLYIEIEQRHNCGRDIWKTINGICRMGYRGFFSNRGKIFNIQEFKLDIMQSKARRDTERYINNFFFVPDRR